MENSFSSLELRLLQGMMTCSTDTEIAEMLGKPVEEVSAKINEITGGNPPKVRARRGPKPKAKEAREPKRRGRPRSAAPKVKAVKPVKQKEVKKAVPVITSVRLSPQKQAEKHRYETKVVDYNQMIRVQVDRKTWIYVKPGQDPEKAKKSYLKRLAESKSNSFQKDLV